VLEIARRLNRTLDAVAIRRQRLRIAAFGYQGRRWTAKENKLLRTMPDEELAAKLGTTEAALKMAVSRMRQRYGMLLRAEIANTVSNAEEVDEELHALFAALSL